jgi:phospholipid/cholesterol/gamma-HCH transport system substrate-binding protein
MSESPGRNMRLGLMVLAGLALLVTTLYVIGKNENLFGSHFSLRARFRNISGLMKGNNIRFAGIQAGTVRDIRVLNDTSIEVEMSIDKGLQPYIHKNALAAIGTEGLIGNRVVNLIPVAERAAAAEDGDLLPVQKAVSTDDMLVTLDRTNRNLADITDGLKITISKVNGSAALWGLLNDGKMAGNVRMSLARIRDASVQTDEMMAGLRMLVDSIRAGRGSAGRLLVDTGFAAELDAAVGKIRQAGERLGAAGQQAEALAVSAKGLVQDSLLQSRLQASMENIRLGTAAFNQDMEALKHNFLLRGYFRKQEKAEKKRRAQEAADSVTALRRGLP